MKSEYFRRGIAAPLFVICEKASIRRKEPAGGQNVNKVETAVRAIHIPSGISVKATDERSQQQNRKLAYERLILQLHRKNQQILIDAQTENRNRHSSLERGNPVKKFSGPL